MFFRSKNIKQFGDAELIVKYKETGDNTFVGELYERYAHLIFGVCMKYFKNEDDSKDASIQLFEKLLVDLKKHEVGQFKGWLYMVTKNHCLMQLRSRKSEMLKKEEYKKTEEGFMEFCPDFHPSFEDAKEKRLNELESAITKLNEEQKICIEMFYLQRKCYQEVSENTGYSVKQVKSFLQNGKRNLKNYLSLNNE